jgi:hypothetical protein
LNTENDVGDVDNDNDAVGVALRRENHQAATCNGKMLLNKVEYIDKISDNFCDRNVQFSMFSHGFSHGFPAQNDVFEDRISGKPVDLRQLWARDRCHSEKKISPHRKNYENHPNSNFKESSPSKSLKKKPLQNYTPENMEKQRPPSPQKKQKKRGKSAMFPKLHQVTIATATTTTATSQADQPTAASAKQGAQRLPVA